MNGIQITVLLFLPFPKNVHQKSFLPFLSFSFCKSSVLSCNFLRLFDGEYFVLFLKSRNWFLHIFYALWGKCAERSWVKQVFLSLIEKKPSVRTKLSGELKLCVGLEGESTTVFVRREQELNWRWRGRKERGNERELLVEWADAIQQRENWWRENGKREPGEPPSGLVWEHAHSILRLIFSQLLLSPFDTLVLSYIPPPPTLRCRCPSRLDEPNSTTHWFFPHQTCLIQFTEAAATEFN